VKPYGTLRAAAAALVWELGCAKIPPGRSAVDSVHFEGNRAIDEGDIEEKLATTPSPKFLGLWPGVVFDYELFDRHVLQRDLERVERFYRARGFYEAHARAGRVEQAGAHVRVTIVVEEGPPVLVRSVELRGADALPAPLQEAMRAAAEPEVKEGALFDEERFGDAEAAVKRALTDRGYAFAKVTRHATVDIVAHAADAVFEVAPDLPCTIGRVTIEGLGSLPEGPVRRALDIDEGEPFSTAALQRAQQAVLDLGAFSAVEIVPSLPDPPPPNRVVPLTVKVEPTHLHSLMLGGGVELDGIKTETHLIGGWESKSFLGGFRNLQLRAEPGVVFYPTRLPDLEPVTDLLPEGKLQAELRQPGFVEPRTNLVARTEGSVYPLLLATKTNPGEPVVGYRELKGTAGVDRTFWKLYLFPSYDVQWSSPFAYLGELDPALHRVVISYVELVAHFDFRDNPVHPRKGVYLGIDAQLAGLGGDAQDTRVQPEARGYVPITKRLTLAARGSVGFLFPRNYGGLLDVPGGVPSDADRSAWSRDVQIGYFRGFFSGGPSSNRGYPYRGVGPHGVVPFFSPGIAARALRLSCDPRSSAFDPVRCAIPLGGLSLWEASLELRLAVSGPFATAAFCDMSDVSPRELDVRLQRPHVSCGAGLRYDTPVGPIRLDVGYRIPGLQTLEPATVREEGVPGTIFGAPVAVAFGLGEAF
jgi:outer membrane protein insertion porin family/translocation and assembly module TamA